MAQERDDSNNYQYPGILSVNDNVRLEGEESCSACGKALRDKGGGDLLIGLVISIKSKGGMPLSPERLEFVKKQMGEYVLDKEYCICFECRLRSLGAKP